MKNETFTPERIKAEADAFFEWDGEDRSLVTTTSCLLFAQHIAGLMQARAAQPAPVVPEGSIYVECRQCDKCQHVGINDAAHGLAACHDCDWSGNEPEDDKCPGCKSENCMAAACPECGARYALIASEDVAAAPAQGQQVECQACERLRSQVSALQSDANSWQSGYDKGREDGAKAAEGWKAQHARDSAELRKLCAERDALRAENERLNAQFNECARLFVDATEQACKAQRERDELRAELEAARGLLRHASSVLGSQGWDALTHEIDTLLTATPAPEVPDHIEQHLKMVEQGERQEVWARQCDLDESDPALFVARERVEESGYTVRLTTATQPGQDVRLLVSADDVRDACANAVSVFAEEANADQCREVAEYMREVLLAQIAKQQAKGKGGKHE